MVVKAGCLIIRDNQILMVKETKEICYGQLNFLARHVDEGEKITTVAIRETYEETGCKVKLTGVLTIVTVDLVEKRLRLMVRFTADVIEELRGYNTSIQFIKYYEEGKIYTLEVFNDTNYVREK